MQGFSMLGFYGSLSQNGCTGLEYLQLPQQCLYFCVCGVCVWLRVCVGEGVRVRVRVWWRVDRGSQKKPAEGGEEHFIMKGLHSLFMSKATRS